jgi:hypothetical protein
MPHASAALKKLRKTNDVVRDDQHIRGSRYRLSSQGLNRLEADGLERLLGLVQWPPPPGAAGIILGRDGPMLLLGYTSNPKGPLLGLPNRPMDDYSGVLRNSNGNKGEPHEWRWAVMRGDKPSWYDLETHRLTSAPSELVPTTLAAWMESPKVMGVIRARLLEEDTIWPLGVGSWFMEMPQGYWPELPNDLRSGPIVIGRAGNTGPLVKPQGPIHAKLNRRLELTQLLSSFGNDCLIIGDGSLIGRKKSPLPFDIIEHWLKKIHPRLSPVTIKERADKLISNLKNQQSTALTRRLLVDFPGREWNSEVEYLDTTGLSLVAGESILSTVLATSKKQFVVHWKWNESSDELYKVSTDERCCLLIAQNFRSNMPFHLSSTNGQLKLQLPSRIHLPIKLESSNLLRPEDWTPPGKPSDLERGNMTTVIDANEELDALWAACSLANGDDSWADRHERKFPLASWIASSESSRVSRWRRISKEVDVKWSTLCNLKDFDLVDLCDIAVSIDEALDELVNRIRANPMLVHQKAELVNNSAMATAILLSIQWFDELPDVITTWLKSPMRIKEVLRVCWEKSFVEQLITSSPSHARLYEGEIISKEDAISIMEEVHFDLWKDKAVDLLMLALSTTSGRNRMALIPLPWPVILCQHSLKSSELTLIHHMENGPGTDSLLDSYDGLVAAESNSLPGPGRTHPLSGWLFQQKTPLIESNVTGDIEIHLALHRRVQQ